jgi:hypothetical protein
MGDIHVTSVSIECVLPVTSMQEGLLFHTQFAEDGPNFYAMHLSALLSGPLDAAKLRSACEQMQARHQCLRGCFRENRANQVVQVVLRDVPLAWRQVDLAGYPESERTERLGRLTEAALSERFDPAKPPLSRYLLVRLAPDQHRFIIWTSPAPPCLRRRPPRITTAGWPSRTVRRRRAPGRPRSPGCQGPPCWRRLIPAGGWLAARSSGSSCRPSWSRTCETSAAAAA